MTLSTELTDVRVVSLDDRRRIKDLEAKTALLEQELAEARGVLRPALTRELGDCLHMGVFSVSDHTPEITCNACNAKVDPYEVLRKISHREVNFCYTLNALRKEAEHLRAEVDKLKAARSRIRRKVRGSEDIEPLGIAQIMRTYKLHAIQLAMSPGGQHGMAIAQMQGDARKERCLRADGDDLEAAISKLIRQLEDRVADSSSSAQ